MTPTSGRQQARPPRVRAIRSDAAARIALDHLLQAIESELSHRRAEAELEAASQAPVAIARLASIGRDLPNLARLTMRAAKHAGRTNSHDVAAALRGLADGIGAYQQTTRQRVAGASEIDDFGFDAEWSRALLPLLRFLYRRWWRVTVRGIHNVPAEGRALLVANHAGVFPYDAAMVRMAVLEEHPLGRHVRALMPAGTLAQPFASWMLRRGGNAVANSDDARRLLASDELVLAFPEGTRGSGKLYRDRYQLGRFGRGSYVELACDADAPIVPVSIVGSEEIHPMLADIGWLARLTGQPHMPITPTLPVLGPLGMVPLPATWVMEFHPPIDARRALHDRVSALAVSDKIRSVIQTGVYDNLERRGSVFALS